MTPRRRRLPPWGMAVAVFLLAAAVSTAVIWRLDRTRRRGSELQADTAAADYASALQRRLDETLSVVYELQELVQQGHGEVVDFEAVASRLLSRHPGAAALELAPRGIIRHIAPLSGNEAALQHEVSRDFPSAEQYRRAQEPGRVTLTITRGGTGVVVRLPAYLDDQQGRAAFWGFAMALVRLPEALESLLAPLPGRGFGYRVSRIEPETGKVQAIAASPGEPLQKPETRDVRVPGGTWTLSVAPRSTWLNHALLGLDITLGLLLSLLLATLAKLLVESRSHGAQLAQLVDERTKEIRQSEERLRLAAEGAQMGTWHMDAATGTISASPLCCAHLGFPPGGLTSYDLFISALHPDDKERVHRVIDQAFDDRGDYEAEYRAVWRDGSEHWVAAVGRVFLGAGGAVFAEGVTRDVSARKQRDLQIRELNANLERMVEDRTADLTATLDAIPDLLFEMDETGRYLDVRARHAQLLTPSSRLIGADVRDLLPAAAAATVCATLRAAAETGRDSGRIVRLPSADGDRWFELSAARKRSDADGPRRLVLLARNITQRRAAELALRKTARALRLLSDCMGALLQAESEESLLEVICRLSCETGGYRMAWVGFAEHDPARAIRPVARWGDDGGYLDSVHISWNESSDFGLGPTGAAIRTGTTTTDADLATDPGMEPWRESAPQHGFRSAIALPLGHRGAVMGALTMYSSEPNAFSPDEVMLLEELAANLAFGLGTFRERRRRLAAEVDIKAKSDLLASVTDSANDAILMMDARGTIAYWNPAAERIFGHTAGEAIGKDLHELLAPEPERAAFRAAFPEFLRTSQGPTAGKSLELTALHKNGAKIPVALSLSALTLDGERCAVGVLRDIADRKRHEAELLAAKEAAESAAAAKGEFISNLSHEIRTPMTAILGLSQVLMGEALRPNQRETARQIRSAGRYLIGIIDDILDFSKLEAGRVEVDSERFDLADLLAHSDSLLGAPARAKGLSFRIDRPDDVPRGLIGDDLRLQRILMNLVANAIKFTDEGHVQVHVRMLDRTADRVRLRFEVRDTGIGIPPDALKKLFSPFTQADCSISRRFGGTGLGLSISKRLVEVMGGVIGVNSVVGVGSTFWFELPFGAVSDDAAPARFEMPDAVLAGPRLAGLRILVVDDNHLNLLVVGRMLEQEGAQAVPAADGQDAIDYLQAHGDGVDAVLMDVQMPVMDGLAATRRLRQLPNLARLPVIALSAGVLPGQQREAHAAGIDAFLPKPVEMDEMVATLLRLTANRPASRVL